MSPHPHDGDSAPAPRDERESEPRQGAGDPRRTCPNCGAALHDRSCKLLCPTPGCGYYLSCSDFY